MPGCIKKQLHKYQQKNPKNPKIHHIQQYQRNTVNQHKKRYHQMTPPMLDQMVSPVFRKLLVAYFIIPDPSTQQLFCHSQHWQVNNQNQ